MNLSEVLQELFKNKTQGEVLKLVFPNLKTRGENGDFISFTLDGIVGVTVSKDWWDKQWEIWN